MTLCTPGNNRRDFLKKTSALAALYLTPSLLTQAYAVDQVMPLPVPKEKIHLEINGTPYDLEIDARISLLDLLREQIGLTGTKKGCDMGHCGACIIHVNGKRLNSCLFMAVDSNNSQITTIEGLAQGDQLHPMQAAFLKHDGFQCGFCTSGQIMSAVACVREGQANSREQVQEYMDTNICRCGAYQNIVNAILEVKQSGVKV